MYPSVSAARIREELQAHLADVLYCTTDEITDDASFNDLGLDSVLAVELISLLNVKYGLDETLDSIYKHPTLRELTTHIHTLAMASGASGA